MTTVGSTTRYNSSNTADCSVAVENGQTDTHTHTHTLVIEKRIKSVAHATHIYVYQLHVSANSI